MKLFLYYCKYIIPDEYYNLIFSDTRNGMLKKSVVPKFTKRDGKYDMFIDTHFVNADISSKDDYDKIIRESDAITYDEDVFHEKAVFDLERQFRVRDNEFLYNINGILVSRNKVLRTLSILKNVGVNITSEEVMYAVTKGMHLAKDSLDKVSKSVGYVKEGEMVHELH